MSASVLLTMTSCNSEDTSDKSFISLSKVPLQVSIDNVKTRSIVEGAILPNNSSYRIHVYSTDEKNKYVSLNNTDGSSVAYVDGVSKIDDYPIYLPDDGSGVQVLALYGGLVGVYTENKVVNNIKMNVNKQEDYMVGMNINKVNKSNPKASLSFSHLMSRVTLKIRKAEDNAEFYKIPSVTLNNVKANVILATDGGSPIVSEQNNETTSITLKNSNYTLDTSSDVITADFLLLPISQEGITIELNGISQTANLPVSDFGMGQHFMFNVVISDNKMKIEDVTVTPWGDSENEDDDIKFYN